MRDRRWWDTRPEVLATGGLGPEDFLYNLGDVSTGLALCLAHQPRFRIHRGCLIVVDARNEDVDQWIASLPDPTDVERLVNHVHVWDLLDVHGPAAVAFGEWLAAGRRSSAAAQFPDRDFESSAVSGGHGIEVTVWTVRSAGDNAEHVR